jgi:hypothetical protein
MNSSWKESGFRPKKVTEKIKTHISYQVLPPPLTENGAAYKWLNIVWLHKRSDFHVRVIETRMTRVIIVYEMFVIWKIQTLVPPKV